MALPYYGQLGLRRGLDPAMFSDKPGNRDHQYETTVDTATHQYSYGDSIAVIRVGSKTFKVSRKPSPNRLLSRG